MVVSIDDGVGCKKCSGTKDRSVRHKSHMENPTKGEQKFDEHGHKPRDLVTICADCHDDIHDEDRERRW